MDNTVINNSVIEFGKALLDECDLDPVYDLIAASSMEKEQLDKWLVAYSMFYHAGLARKLADLPYFYEAIVLGFREWPRSEERRHFRGQVALNAVEVMRSKTPTEHVNFWYQEPLDFKSVSERVQTYPLYGPWIAFKLADMGERCLRLPIDFSNCELGIYREPRAGAALALTGDDKAKITNEQLAMVIDYITYTLNSLGYRAPPWNDRLLNVQEAETILCKWKSHMHGHYPVGKDKKAVKESLERYGYQASL